MPTEYTEVPIGRNGLRGLIQSLTDRGPNGKPRFPIFSVYCARRGPLYKRYAPVNDWTDGPLVREGDILSPDGQTVTDAQGRVFEMNPTDDEQKNKHQIGRSKIFLRRGGDKVILEDVGTFRWMVIKNYDPTNPTMRKHYDPRGKIQVMKDAGILPLSFPNPPQRESSNYFNPADYDLFRVHGMYNDSPKDVNGEKMVGRYGQWRPWAQICLRSATKIRVNGIEYQIPNPIMPVAGETIKERLVA